MGQHIQFTMILFFINILISFLFPQYVFIQNNIYTDTIYGEVQTNAVFLNSVTGGLSGNKSTAISSFGLLDALLLVWEFLKYILNFVVALPTLIYLLPIASAVKIVFFFPILLMYSFAIIGWIRRG